MNGGKIFRAEVRSAFPEWNRYGVRMTAVCFDGEGRMVDYVSPGADPAVDPAAANGSVAEVGSADGSGPAIGVGSAAACVLETPPCDHADIYLYVIANTFPASDVIAASPPFEIELAVSVDGGTPKTTTYLVNQWGGLSVKRTVA